MSALRPARRAGWLRHPVVHFAILGLVVFIGQRALRGDADVARAPSPVAAEIEIDVGALREAFVRGTRRQPTEEELAALVERRVEEQLLYREALRRGFDRHSPNVRNWLVRKMRFVSDSEAPDERLYREALALGLDRDDPVVLRSLANAMRLVVASEVRAQPISEDALRRSLQENADAWQQPARVSFDHVFVSRQERGAAAEAHAEQLLARLQQDGSQWRELGDAYPAGRSFRQRSRLQLQTLLGPEFADGLGELPVDAWHGPVHSAIGLHLVRVTHQTPATLPELDSVRRQVELQLRSEMRKREIAALVAELRSRTRVRLLADAGPRPFPLPFPFEEGAGS